MLSSKVNNSINNIEIEMLVLFIYAKETGPNVYGPVLLMLTKTKIIRNNFVNLKSSRNEINIR